MDNLYIVESPLQALCALETSLNKPEETHGLVVKISNGRRERNDQQVLSIVHRRKWDSLSIIKDIEAKAFPWSLLFNELHTRKIIHQVKTQFPKGISRLYLGEFRSVFMHRVKCALKIHEVFLLDDGTATLQLVRQYFSKGYFFPKNTLFFKSKIKRYLPNALHFRTLNFKRLNKRIGLSTVYHQINYAPIEPIYFSKIKDLFKRKQVIDPSLVYYYGSRYSELKIVSLAYELDFLSQIADFYKKQNKRVIYFAHRYESSKKLDLIANQLGFEVSTPEQTAEVYLLESATLPLEIASAFSSLLINCTFLFPEIQQRSFKLSHNEISERFRSEIEMIYTYFQNAQITLHEIEATPAAQQTSEKNQDQS